MASSHLTLWTEDYNEGEIYWLSQSSPPPPSLAQSHGSWVRWAPAWAHSGKICVATLFKVRCTWILGSPFWISLTSVSFSHELESGICFQSNYIHSERLLTWKRLKGMPDDLKMRLETGHWGWARNSRQGKKKKKEKKSREKGGLGLYRICRVHTHTHTHPSPLSRTVGLNLSCMLEPRGQL